MAGGRDGPSLKRCVLRLELSWNRTSHLPCLMFLSQAVQLSMDGLACDAQL